MGWITSCLFRTCKYLEAVSSSPLQEKGVFFSTRYRFALEIPVVIYFSIVDYHAIENWSEIGFKIK